MFCSMGCKVSTKGISALRTPDRDIHIKCVKHFCDHFFWTEREMKGSLVVMSLIPTSSFFQSKIIQALN